MSIRKQSIISSVIVYVGFSIGLFNTYLFTREGGVAIELFGLTAAFIAMANVFYAVAGFAMPGYIAKFFPYYQAHLKPKENDQMTWALFLPCIGFGLAIGVVTLAKPLLVQFFSNSPLFLTYFNYTFIFGFGYTIFTVLEAYAWQQRKPVLSNLLKEVAFRLIVTVLVVMLTMRLFDESMFMQLYAFTYLALVIFLIIHFRRSGQLPIVFRKSRVSKRFYRKIRALVSYVYPGSVIFILAGVFDSIAILLALPNALLVLGIFTLAQNISSLVQAPQRAVISSVVGPLSQAWKEKDHQRIQRIYERSSINQLLFALMMFLLIWLNFSDGIQTFNLRDEYASAKNVFLLLGIARVVDMGTGVNAQIIGTSTAWRFEFLSGLILLALMFPLTWTLTRYMGIEGTALANILSFTAYNAVRYVYLYRKFGFQPFTYQSLLAVVIAAVATAITFLLFNNEQGIQWLVIRSFCFLIIFGGGVLLLRLSPDVAPVFQTIKKRLGLRTE